MVENFLVANLKKNKSINDYKNLLLNGESPWIAIGDSHTARSLINSSTIDNLGYAADNLDSMLSKSLFRINRLKPKGIILQATPHIFSFNRLSDNQKQKTDYLIAKNTYIFEFLNPLNRPYLINHLKLIFKNKFLIKYKEKNEEKIKKNWLLKSPQTKNYETSTRVQLHTPILEFKDHLSLRQYKKMIKSFIKQDIKVCLVRYPVSKFYLNKTKFIRVFSEVNTTLKEIANNNNLNFLDLSDNLDEKHFSDTDHILPDSKYLVTELIKKGCKIND